MSARRFISARAVTARGRYLHELEMMKGEERREQGNRRMTRQRAVKVLKGAPCLMDLQNMRLSHVSTCKVPSKGLLAPVVGVQPRRWPGHGGEHPQCIRGRCRGTGTVRCGPAPPLPVILGGLQQASELGRQVGTTQGLPQTVGEARQRTALLS